MFVGLSPSVFVSCMDYHCTIFFPCSFFASGVNVFCSIWLSPTCVCMLGIQLFICIFVELAWVGFGCYGVSIGSVKLWVWLLGKIINAVRGRYQVCSSPVLLTVNLSFVPLVVLIVFIPDLVSHSPFIFPWTLVYSPCFLFAEDPARQTHNPN